MLDSFRVGSCCFQAVCTFARRKSILLFQGQEKLWKRTSHGEKLIVFFQERLRFLAFKPLVSWRKTSPEKIHSLFV
ncbi:hypothetical protein AFK71_04400 [Virgibacillus pantothenticus]|uniref:Uncharacterized protein n=1 Tax=Virgibacillus pantothenticus TaxID=1473 RepID=A0A0L0QU72_VIRPA|nr:hypothetical protein AFK71_04400 [Virgibacillus pantothenticus]